MVNRKALENAEKKARLRDIQNEKILTEEELQIANELQAKANSRGMKLVPERKIKSKVKFVQHIQENWNYLNQTKYLTNPEKVFLLDIQSQIGFQTNCIVFDIKAKQQEAMTQSDIARYLEVDRSHVNRLVKKLTDKGIIVKALGSKEGVTARNYSLYVNPNIMFSGDRDNINPILKIMFQKVPKELKEMPIKLF